MRMSDISKMLSPGIKKATKLLVTLAAQLTDYKESIPAMLTLRTAI